MSERDVVRVVPMFTGTTRQVLPLKCDALEGGQEVAITFPWVFQVAGSSPD